MNSYYSHPTAIIELNASIGDDSKIWHFCHILGGAKIGKGTSLGQNCVVMNKATIGDGCKLQNNISVYSGVTIEDEVFLGPSMVFTNILIPRAHINRQSEYVATVVKRRASIGANATIICGVTIGKYALVGAGAVVTKDVPDHAIVVGNPATLMAWACQCGQKLEHKNKCPHCKESYQLTDTGPQFT